MTDVADRATIHHYLTPSRIKKDECDVQALIDLFKKTGLILLRIDKLGL